MDTEQQSELKAIKQLISDRFDKQDEKIDEIKIEMIKVESRLSLKINEVESRLSLKINEVESGLGLKLNEVESKLAQEIAGIKVDINWIKWLFGGLLSFILILLSAIISVLFKLIS